MNQSESNTEHGTRSRRVNSGIVSVGAAVALMLAGLGVATAQTADPTSTTTSTAPASEDQPRSHCHHGPRANLAQAARTIGISEADLITALRSGQSMAQVAQSENVDPQKVIDALVADAKAKLAEKVSSGELTQAQADEKAATLTERVTEMVNRAGLPRLHGPGEGRHGRGGPGPDGRPRPEGQAPAEAPASAS